MVDGLSTRVALDRRYAIVGGSGSGKEELSMLIARLLDPDNGSLSIGGRDAAGLFEGVTGRRISYVGSHPFVFSGTLADNLFFGLKHKPMSEVEYQDEQAAQRRMYLAEAHRSGNIDYDLRADWIDYAAAGADGPEALRQQALAALDMVDMDEEIYRFGLRGTIDPTARPDLAEAILRAREGFRDRLSQDPALTELVETFDRDSYNLNASVGENLLFGNPVSETFDVERLAENPYVLTVLDDTGLTSDFLTVGYQAAATMVELFADLPPDHELFQQFSFVSADDLPELQALLQRGDKANLEALSEFDRGMLLSLPFKLIPARHRLGLIDDAMQEKILSARRHFADNLPEHMAEAIEFFDVARYNAAANIQDNILFGKIAYGQAQASERVGALMREVVDELALRDTVAEAGLSFDVGIAGSRLTGAQRQKLALARAVLKRPDVLILSEPTTSLDSGAQGKIMNNILTAFQGRCLIWAVQRASMAQDFDEVLVMRQGQLLEQGSYTDLSQNNDYVREMLAAE